MVKIFCGEVRLLPKPVQLHDQSFIGPSRYRHPWRIASQIMSQLETGSAIRNVIVAVEYGIAPKLDACLRGMNRQ